MKSNNQELRQEMKSDIRELRQEMKSNFRWTLGILLTTTIAIIVLIISKH